MGEFFRWLRDLFFDAVDGIRGFLSNLASDFRESNRYFKIKAGLIGGYLVVGAATAIVFIPPGELNEIDASVRISRTEIVGGKYFLVRNQSSDPWKRMELTLNGSYFQTWPRLRPGKKKAFFFNRFKDEGGREPGEALIVRTLRIECDQGAFERDFQKE